MIIFENAVEHRAIECDRAVYIDILKIIACILIIFNHTDTRGFFRYVSDDLGTIIWGQNLLFSIFCKSAVPLFFMISGSLLLRKEEPIRKTLKRISKFLIDLLLFSIAYKWIDSIITGNQFSICDTLFTIVSSAYWHLWYLYAYIAFLLTLPFLRKMVQGLDVKGAVYLFIMSTIMMGVIPIIEYFGMLKIYVYLKPYWMTSEMFVYPVIGYILDNRVDIQTVKKKHMLCLFVINIICFVITEISEYFYLLKEPGNTSETFLVGFSLVNAVTVFITVKYLMKNFKINGTLYRIITETGKCTYGIYLIHIWFLWKIPFFYEKWIKIEQGGIFGSYSGIFVSCIAVFMITGILRKIPLIRKLL